MRGRVGKTLVQGVIIIFFAFILISYNFTVPLTRRRERSAGAAAKLTLKT